MKIFKVTYQDKALNKRVVELQSAYWADIIAHAFAHKKAEEKILYIEPVTDTTDVTGLGDWLDD